MKRNALTFEIQPCAELVRTAEEQVAGHLREVYLAPDKLGSAEIHSVEACVPLFQDFSLPILVGQPHHKIAFRGNCVVFVRKDRTDASNLQCILVLEPVKHCSAFPVGNLVVVRNMVCHDVLPMSRQLGEFTMVTED